MKIQKLRPKGLEAALEQAGSDKGKWYGGLYEVLLRPHRHNVRCLFEIGIGTMIPNAASSMVGWAGKGYKPGASLRVWRDYLPNAEIHGFDVANDTQFSGEVRIFTHLCDSTNTVASTALISTINRKPDIVIDDGLHTADAQIKTFKNFFPSLREGGLYVIEDVVHSHEIGMIIDEVAEYCPEAHAFVYRTTETWAAIVIRSPQGNG